MAELTILSIGARRDHPPQLCFICDGSITGTPMAVTLPDYSDKTRWDDAAGAAMRRVREADPDAADLPVFQGAQAHVCGEQTGKRALAFHFVER